MLSFKPTVSLSSFTFIKRIFSSSLSGIRVVSSTYLRFLVFLPAILVPTCASSSLAFHMTYSVCKLNKHGDSVYCQGPASAGSRGTLRMNGIGKRKRGREREKERDQIGGVQQSLAMLFFFFFTVAFIP